MIVAGLSQGLVYQLVSFGGIAVLHGGIAVLSREIGEALGRHLVNPQAASGDLWLLLQHPGPSGLVLAVIEPLGGPVDQLLPLQLHSAAC